MSERVAFTDRVEAHFRQHPGEWVNAQTLMKIGGTFAWRTRVSELRTERGMQIDNRQRRMVNADGKKFTVSEYRFSQPVVSLLEQMEQPSV